MDDERKIIEFPTPEHIKHGFVEFNKLELEIKNTYKAKKGYYLQLDTEEQIERVNGEIEAIAELILNAIKKLSSVTPDLPTIEDFSERTYELLILPLHYGKNPASSEQYTYDEAHTDVVIAYQQKLLELSPSELDDE